MEQELKSHLTTLAAAYTAATGASSSSIWRSIMNDAFFITRIMRGGSFTARTYDRAVVWFSDHWPADVDWPEGVPRLLSATAA